MRRTTILPLLGALLGTASACVCGGCDADGGAPAQPVPAKAAASGSAESVEQSFLRICDGGNDEACDKLIAKYAFGDGIPKDEVKAAKLAQRLCTKEARTYFCPTFAFMKQEGKGMPKDVEGARAFFEETCEDDPVGCSDYGQLYVSGSGVEKNPELGLALLDMACKYGEAKACERFRNASPLAP